MKAGRIVLLDQVFGRPAAACIDDGQVTDLLIDADDDIPRPGAIYRAVAQRPMKGQGGITLDLGDGQTGYLRQGKGVAPGDRMLVQVVSHTDSGKAAPVTTRLMFKSRYAIVTPGAPGRNIARKIRDDAERDRLAELAHDGMEGADPGLGLILRTSCNEVDGETIAEDIAAMRGLAEAVLADGTGGPELLVDAPSAAEQAWRDWVDPDPDEVVEREGALEDLGLRDAIDALLSPRAELPGGGFAMIEPTTAMVAVDVNTGGDTSFAAGLKANLACARDLPRQLRLRGLGGQIVIDMAPMPHKERRKVEDALRKSLRADGIETALVGWTGLGHLELQRKRERRPLASLVNGPQTG